jgi:hypothetical protein
VGQAPQVVLAEDHLTARFARHECIVPPLAALSLVPAERVSLRSALCRARSLSVTTRLIDATP